MAQTKLWDQFKNLTSAGSQGSMGRYAGQVHNAAAENALSGRAYHNSMNNINNVQKGLNEGGPQFEIADPQAPPIPNAPAGGMFPMGGGFDANALNSPMNISPIQVPEIKLPGLEGIRSALDSQFGASREALNIDLERQARPAREQRYESLSERGLTDSGLGDRVNRMGEEDLQQTQRQAFLELQSNRMAAEAQMLQQRNEQEFNAAIQSGNWQQAAQIENKNIKISVKQLELDTANVLDRIRGTDAEIEFNRIRSEIDKLRYELEVKGQMTEEKALALTDYQNRQINCDAENKDDGDSYHTCMALAGNDLIRSYGDLWPEGDAPWVLDEDVEQYRLGDSPEENRQAQADDLQRRRVDWVNGVG